MLECLVKQETYLVKRCQGGLVGEAARDGEGDGGVVREAGCGAVQVGCGALVPLDRAVGHLEDAGKEGGWWVVKCLGGWVGGWVGAWVGGLVGGWVGG